MKEFRERLARWWGSLSGNRKSALLVAGAAVLLALVFFVQWLGRVDYAPLFTQLEAKEASGVVAKLKELNIPYQLADQGQTVLVPREQVYDLRLQLAGEGLLPTGGVGFELFDRTQLGVTDFDRQLNYQRALQEELRRTIVQMDEVEQARVHLVLPEPSVFVREDRPASAAVTLKLKPLAKVTPEQVKAIIYLVSASVANLPPENVRVLDTQGRVLSDEVALGEADMSQQRLRQMELTREFERNLERRLQGMLERILGPGKAVAMITADLDFNRREVTRIEYADTGVIRSEQTVQDQQTSTGAAPVGGQNVPTYPAGGGGQSTSSHTERTTNYEVPQTEEKVVYAPGQVRSISTAVAVDGVLDNQTVQQIQQIVTAAIGYQQGRDQLTVTSMAFDNTEAQQAQAAIAEQEARAAREQRLRQYVTWGVGGVAALLVTIIMLVTLRRRRAPREVEVSLPVALPEGTTLQQAEAAVAAAAMAAAARPVLSPEEAARRDQQKRAREIAKQKPEEAIQLVKAWLSEE